MRDHPIRRTSVVALAGLIVAAAVGAAGFEPAPTKRDMAVSGLSAPGPRSGHGPREGRAPTAPQAAQLLPNGDFEQGQTVWTEYSQYDFDIIMNSGYPHPVLPFSGAWLAWLGGAYDEISYIEQQVMVPPGTSSLTYWHWIWSEDLCGFDFATLSVNGSAVEQYDLCEDENTLGWILHQVDIASYAGQTVTIRIRVDTDDTWNSNLFVDDVAFEGLELLFADGFESGDLSAWSGTVP